jgi:uncharacterized BrkB/YihY/UPF0761 family membrane protein
MSFVLAVIAFAVTIALSGLVMLANGMSDAPGSNEPVWPILAGGMLLTVLLASLHWWGPQLSW